MGSMILFPTLSSIIHLPDQIALKVDVFQLAFQIRLMLYSYRVVTVLLRRKRGEELVN